MAANEGALELLLKKGSKYQQSTLFHPRTEASIGSPDDIGLLSGLSLVQELHSFDSLVDNLCSDFSVVDKVVNPTLNDLFRISFNKFLKYLLLSPIKKLSPSTILVRIPMISTFWIRISNMFNNLYEF